MSNILLYKDINGGEWIDFAAHKFPEFKETNNSEWILWGTDPDWKNQQPDYYDWLYNSSSKHRAIINRKNLFINGKGVKVGGAKLTTEQSIQAESFAFKINDSDFTKKITLNLLKYGGFCYEVIKSKNGKKLEFHYVNIKNVRRSKVEYDKDGNEKKPIYGYTRNWKPKMGGAEDNPDFKTFHPFDWDIKEMDSSKRYLVVYYQDDESLYPIPEYSASIPYIAADYEVGNFVYNNTRKGFSASFFIEFVNGDPTEDQKAEVVEMVKSTLHGSDNGGDPAVNFIEDKENGTIIQPIPNNGQDDRYVNLNKQIREEIFTGHTVNPVVVGLKGETGFSNNADELRTAIEEFESYYVTVQRGIVEQHINALRMINGIKGELYIQRLDPIQTIVSENELKEILTKNERRERAGYEEIEGGDTIETSTTNVQLQFKKDVDNYFIEQFSNCGIEDERLEFLASAELYASDIQDAKFQADELLKKHTFVNELENSILSILQTNQNASVKELSKLLGESEAEIQKSLTNIEEQGLTTPQSEVIAVYKYVKRSDVSGASVLPTTRPFCANLVTMSQTKSWTIQDIQAMNNGTGLDVFSSRGGWYTLPGRSPAVRVPFCRHVWEVRLATIK